MRGRRLRIWFGAALTMLAAATVPVGRQDRAEAACSPSRPAAAMLSTIFSQPGVGRTATTAG